MKTYYLKTERDPIATSSCVSKTLCLRLVAILKSDTAVTKHPDTGFKSLISTLLCCYAYIYYCSFCPSRANKMKILKKIFQSTQLVAFYTHESLLDLFPLDLYRISSTKKFAMRSNWEIAHEALFKARNWHRGDGVGWTKRAWPPELRPRSIGTTREMVLLTHTEILPIDCLDAERCISRGKDTWYQELDDNGWRFGRNVKESVSGLNTQTENKETTF
jgi:hypothetical protein